MTTFDLSARVVRMSDESVLVDFNDSSVGLQLVDPVVRPDEESRRPRYTSPRSHGDFTSGPALDAAGTLVLNVRVSGSTWAQVATRWETARTAYRSEWDFYVDLEEDGVTTRWISDRPSVTPSEIGRRERSQKSIVYQLRFICQPNPVVTIA